MIRFALLAIGGLLLLGGTARAQYRDRYTEDQYNRYGRSTMNRVRSDLDRLAPRIAYLPDFELRRFDAARERLATFERKWERGRFDGEDVNQAIQELREIVDRDRLRPHDRDIMQDCMARLREMRERFERHAT